MKSKIITFLLILEFATVNSMENCQEKPIKLKNMLFDVPSLKLIAAWQVANTQDKILVSQVGEIELVNLVNRAKNIQLHCNSSILSLEEKLFVNLFIDPNFSIKKIKKHFPELIKKYLKNKKLQSKVQLFNVLLLHACKKNNSSIAWLSIFFGANIEVRDKYKDTPLILAAADGSKSIVKLLLQMGADVNAENEEWLETALMNACQWNNDQSGVHKKDNKIVQLLVRAGATINTQSWDCSTALMKAASRGKKKVIKTLLRNGADINCVDREGRSALYFAQKEGHAGATRILLRAQNSSNICSINNKK